MAKRKLVIFEQGCYSDFCYSVYEAPMESSAKDVVDEYQEHTRSTTWEQRSEAGTAGFESWLEKIHPEFTHSQIETAYIGP